MLFTLSRSLAKHLVGRSFQTVETSNGMTINSHFIYYLKRPLISKTTFRDKIKYISHSIIIPLIYFLKNNMYLGFPDILCDNYVHDHFRGEESKSKSD